MLRRVLPIALALALAGTGCSDGDSGTTLPPDPDALVAVAADAIENVGSLHFDMDRSGAPVVVSGLQFNSAVGEYAAPESVKAVLEMVAGGITVELGTIAIGERVWLTNPLTQRFDEFPPGEGFNPAILFQPGIGLGPLLRDDFVVESFPGLQGSGRSARYVIDGMVSGPRVRILTAGLVEEQEVPLQLHIDPATGHLTEARFSTEGDDGRSDWVLVLSEFDEPVTVVPPEES